MAPGVAAVAGELQADAAAKVWALAEPCGARKIGEVMTPPEGLLGEYGLMQVDLRLECSSIPFGR